MNSSKNEGIKKSISANNGEIADRLRFIRKSLRPRMSQNDFYNTYLAQFKLVKTQIGEPGKNSVQNYMKKLENGMIEVPAVILPVYAALSGHSVEYLLTGKESSGTGAGLPQEMTVRFICEMLVRMFEEGNANIQCQEISRKEIAFRNNWAGPEEYEYTAREIDSTYPAFYFSNNFDVGSEYDPMGSNYCREAGSINAFLNQYIQLKDIRDKDILPEELYQNALDGMLLHLE